MASETEKQAARWRHLMANYHAIQSENQAAKPAVFFKGEGGNLRRAQAEIEATFDAAIAQEGK